MVPSLLKGVYLDGNSQVLWEDGEWVFCRGWRLGDDGNPSAVLVVLPATERPSPSSLDRLAHEYGLKDERDGTWAVQPLELVRDGGCTMLRLLRSLGIDVQLFASISDFLKSDPPDGPTCLVLDVRLPGQSGLELQRELAQAKRELPFIFITGHGDIPMSVQAMKGGAIEFLTKPFRDQDLLEAFARSCMAGK